MGIVEAERIKLTTTRSPWWCSAIVVVIGVGFAIIAGFAAKSADHPGVVSVHTVTDGVGQLGVMVLMIMAALTVTSEYRFGIIRNTFLAEPNRAEVLVVKALMTAIYSAVVTLVLSLVAFLVAKMVAGDSAPLTLSSDTDWRAIYGNAIYAFLAAILAVGVGALVRQSAAAISLIVLWPLLVESLLGGIGSFGRTVNPFLPFANINHFLADSTQSNWHWGPWGGLVYFAAFVAIVFLAALMLLDRRDA
ncbi:MAG: ABC transporter permease [Nocardia sp.]|nr:ABC transporter permease [Nocardia sp.]